jgi:hypothetical protein
MCNEFIKRALVIIGKLHGRLLNLAIRVSDDDLFVTLSLLYFSGVHMFGHMIVAIHTEIIASFATVRDTAMTQYFQTTKDNEVSGNTTHALLPVCVGGAALLSPTIHSTGTDLGNY